jgi:hypothetical protein
MDKIFTVEFLKQGDKFEFVSERTETTKPVVMIVTRDPAVNKAANSCFFRYQADDATGATDRKWDGAQSWNGTPDAKVRILERETAVEPAAATAATARAKTEKPVGKKKSAKSED